MNINIYVNCPPYHSMVLPIEDSSTVIIYHGVLTIIHVHMLYKIDPNFNFI